MQISGNDVKAILLKHGYTPSPNESLNPSIVVEDGEQLYVDVNSFVVRYGVNKDQVPDYPIRIFLKTMNSQMGTVGLDVIKVRELTAEEKTTAEPRRDWYPKTSPWPEKT
jgi:hypothetical protein